MTWTRERWQRIESLFHEVAAVEGGERATRLAEVCGADHDLRLAVERLLVADAEPASAWLDDGAAAALRADDPLLAQRFGPFRLIERIAEGGMGTVYRATRSDGDFEQEVAVKVLRLGLSTSAMRDRFARERQTLARLVHPNVARLLDGGTTAAGVPFFAMELVDGVPIDRFCDHHGWSLRQRLQLFAVVLRAVQFAHQNLIVHLDLKPSNVLVDMHGQPKLVDFGVAGLLEGVADAPAEVAATRSRPITPEYASPELLRGDAISTAADVYSLGVVLYELLTGSRAFRSTRSDLDLMRTVCETEVPRPSATFSEGESVAERAQRRAASPGQLVRALHGDLDRIVQKAMRKDASQRYASCREFADDIERNLGGFPIAAREPTLGYRLSRFAQRHRMAAFAVAAVVLSLLGGIASTLRMAQVAWHERDLAASATRVAEQQRDAAAAAQRRAAHEADHARVEAESSQVVAEFLGDTFLSSQFVGDSEQQTRALATIEQRAEQARRQHGADDHLCANLLHALGTACSRIGAFAEAEALLQEAATIRRRNFGDDSLEVALSLGELGHLYYLQGRSDESATVLREAYRLHRQCPRDVHTDVARAANDLAAAERALGNRERAAELHLEALGLRREGGDPVLVAESLNNLANSEPDLQRARGYLEEALRLRDQFLGAEHPLTIQSVANLGTLCLRLEEFSAAKQHLTLAVRQYRALSGLGREGLAMALRMLAMAESGLGDGVAAEAAIDEALALDRQLFGVDNLRVVAAMEFAARIHERQQHWTAAVDLWRQVLAQRTAALPAGHRLLPMTRCSLGTALVRAGEVEAGVAELRVADGELAQDQAASVVDIVDAKLSQALGEEAAGRFDAVERLLLEALRLCHQEDLAAPRAVAVRGYLQAFYRRQGRPADAARHDAATAGAEGR
jgi:serine/threonine-protein kinase